MEEINAEEFDSVFNKICYLQKLKNELQFSDRINDFIINQYKTKYTYQVKYQNRIYHIFNKQYYINSF
jgi:hypothetical protein